METLTNSDWQRLSEFLQSIYAPCSLDAFPERVMAAVPGIIGAETSGFVSFSTCGLGFPYISPRNVTLPQIVTFPDPSIGMAATEFTAQPENFFSHPVATNYLQTFDGQARAISDFLSESEFHCQETLYKSFLERFGIQDQMGIYVTLPHELKISPAIDLFHRHQEHVSLIISRDRRNFTERDRLVLNLIRPHLKQAYDHIVVFHHLQTQLIEQRATTEQAALITLSPDGAVKWMTRQAGEILHRYFPPSNAQITLPDLVQRWANNQISAFSQGVQVCTPISPLNFELNGQRLKIRFSHSTESEAFYLLLEEISEARFSIEAIQQLGLSKRESEVLFWVGNDKTVQEIAQQLGLSDRTVKKHLENIYEKFGVHTRTSALMYALKALGIMG